MLFQPPDHVCGMEWCVAELQRFQSTSGTLCAAGFQMPEDCVGAGNPGMLARQFGQPMADAEGGLADADDEAVQACLGHDGSEFAGLTILQYEKFSRGGAS